uniref:SH3 and multiple ankyrin repeat domains 2 n=1 Tax=Sarcophilus harrisii TaxID=9305 RepID=A0A7N4Q0S8_SARHA
MMVGYNNGRYPRNSLYSDCIIEEKTVVLQKKDNEGFGFVLRGAKADTPIEEFTPTPAFPALQYLESVDEGGVAWQAGLRTGDFLIEVNNENVVKVGHRQVVNMIRQGGNHLILKVVTVTRNLDPDDTARKKAPPPPKRAPTTALTLRSKSMTSELEEPLVHYNQTAKSLFCSPAPAPSRAALDHALLSPAQSKGPWNLTHVLFALQSIYERQGIAVMTPTVPGSPKAPFLGIPRGTMRRQKSIGKTVVKPLKSSPIPAPGGAPRWEKAASHQANPRVPQALGGLLPSPPAACPCPSPQNPGFPLPSSLALPTPPSPGFQSCRPSRLI